MLSCHGTAPLCFPQAAEAAASQLAEEVQRSAAAASEAAQAELVRLRQQEGELLKRVAELGRQAADGQRVEGEQREAVAALKSQVEEARGQVEAAKQSQQQLSDQLAAAKAEAQAERKAGAEAASKAAAAKVRDCACKVALPAVLLLQSAARRVHSWVMPAPPDIPHRRPPRSGLPPWRSSWRRA